MKTIIYQFLIFLVLSSVSCDNMLEESPSTLFEEEDVYNTDDGAESALVGLYSRLNNLQNFGLYYWQLVPALSGTVHSRVSTFQDLVSLNPTLNNVRINGLWTQSYATINIANDILVKLPKYEIDEQVKNKVLGEAYFIRAVTYFNLVRLWGDIPLRLVPTTIDNIHLPRTSVDKIWTTIEEDLQQAKLLLPEPVDQVKGRPHKYAAYALLSKVYMTQASMSDDTDSPFWQKALDQGLEVYNSEAYKLVYPYASLWLPDNENTQESIFEIQQNTQTSEWKTQIYMPPAHPLVNGGTAGGIFRSNKDIYDDHLALYPSDPRIDATYIHSSYTRTDRGNTVLIYPRNKTVQGWPYFLKFYSPERNGFFGTKNYIYFRYGEFLLMMAEIQNELTGPEDAYIYVNQVLARARDIDGDKISDVVEPADWAGMTKEEFRNRIMQERLYELRAEGGEWFENRRRGYDYFLEHVIRKHNNSASFVTNQDIQYSEGVKSMLLPFPAVEINSNRLINSTDQNPGY